MSTDTKLFESERWSGERGDTWDEHIDQFETGIREVGRTAVEAAKPAPGERVLDVGCGGGLTTQWLAEGVAPNGTAIGVDVSAKLIETATRRAHEAGIGNASFVCADAARMTLDVPVDCLFSRFGVMFFDDPYAAFGNLHGLVAEGGRVLMACWGPPPENPWVGELVAAASRHVEVPRPDPRAPGPFAFADVDYVTDILTRAGFSEIAFTPWRGKQRLGGEGATAESAAAFVMNALFLADLLRDQPDALKARVQQAMRDVMQPYETPDGVLLGAMAWLISARA